MNFDKPYVPFVDLKGNQCSIQDIPGDTDSLLLGVSDNTMQLNSDQARELHDALYRWIYTGTIQNYPKNADEFFKRYPGSREVYDKLMTSIKKIYGEVKIVPEYSEHTLELVAVIWIKDMSVDTVHERMRLLEDAWWRDAVNHSINFDFRWISDDE